MFNILYRRKQAKIQWLRDSNQGNIDNLNNIIPETSRHVRKKRSNIGELNIDEIKYRKCQRFV